MVFLFISIINFIRFSFYIDFTNLNDDNLDSSSPLIVTTETQESKQQKDLSRSDDAWVEHEKQQQEINEMPSKGK